MIVCRLKKFVSAFRQDHLQAVLSKKRYLGLFYTAVGWLIITLTNPCYSTNVISLRFLNLCFYQYLISFMTLALWGTFRRKNFFFAKNPVGVVSNSLLGLLCFMAYFLLRARPLSLYSSLFLNLDAIFLTLIAATLLKQKVLSFQWTGVSIALLGLLLGLGGSHTFSISFSLLQGALCALAALSLCFLIISSNYLVRNGNPPLVICLHNCLIGTLFFGAISFMQGMQVPSFQEWTYVLATGVLYAISICFFTAAHKYTEFYLIMPVNYLVPIFNMLFGALFFFKVPSKLEWSSIAVIFLGLSFIYVPYFKMNAEKSALNKERLDPAA